MWKPYLNVIAAWLPQAVHVLDRFHIMKKMNEALDEVRRAEARRLKAEGYEPVLQNSRWCLLKRPQNLTDKTDRQAERVATVQPPERARLSAAGGLPAVLAVRQPLLGGQVPGRVVHADHAEQDRADEESGSQPAPAPPADPQLVRREKQFSSGVVEGLNNKAKLTTKRAYGFSSLKTLQTALYHTRGDLPEPEIAHRFF